MEIISKETAKRFKKQNPGLFVSASRWAGSGLTGKYAYWVEVKFYQDNLYGSKRVLAGAVLCTDDFDTEKFAKEMTVV